MNLIIKQKSQITLVVMFTLISLLGFSQNQIKQKPKLVIGIVIDQMKWEYLNKFRGKSESGFSQLLEGGFECSNTHLNYIPTVTAAGHSSIYTSTVPALHGIVGNDWHNRQQNKKIYCTESPNGEMSPDNLWATTITDELKLASNFQSKVYGVSIKDRGAIIPAGHTANGAFWWNKKNGKWVTSSYYSKNESEWINQYNPTKLVNQYYRKGWKLAQDIALYQNRIYDNHSYQQQVFETATFPHKLKTYTNKDYNKVLYTPYGNELTILLAKKIIAEKKLGTRVGITDFLTISFSSTDYAGHAFGPHSLEVEDIYIQLDKTLKIFIDELKQQYGEDFLIFLTADHGVSAIPQFLASHKLPNANEFGNILDAVNTFGQEAFNTPKLALAFLNAQLYINWQDKKLASLDKTLVINKVKNFLLTTYSDKITFAVNNHLLTSETIPQQLKESIINGYTPTRSGDISIIFKGGSVSQYNQKGTTHFSPYNYDTHIPLIFYGANVPRGNTNRRVVVTDIGTTIAYLLGIPSPNATTGLPIKEIFRP